MTCYATTGGTLPFPSLRQYRTLDLRNALPTPFGLHHLARIIDITHDLGVEYDQVLMTPAQLQLFEGLGRHRQRAYRSPFRQHRLDGHPILAAPQRADSKLLVQSCTPNARESCLRNT